MLFRHFWKAVWVGRRASLPRLGECIARRSSFPLQLGVAAVLAAAVRRLLATSVSDRYPKAPHLSSGLRVQVVAGFLHGAARSRVRPVTTRSPARGTGRCFDFGGMTMTALDRLAVSANEGRRRARRAARAVHTHVYRLQWSTLKAVSLRWARAVGLRLGPAAGSDSVGSTSAAWAGVNKTPGCDVAFVHCLLRQRPPLSGPARARQAASSPHRSSELSSRLRPCLETAAACCWQGGVGPGHAAVCRLGEARRPWAPARRARLPSPGQAPLRLDWRAHWPQRFCQGCWSACRRGRHRPGAGSGLPGGT